MFVVKLLKKVEILGKTGPSTMITLSSIYGNKLQYCIYLKILFFFFFGMKRGIALSCPCLEPGPARSTMFSSKIYSS